MRCRARRPRSGRARSRRRQAPPQTPRPSALRDRLPNARRTPYSPCQGSQRGPEFPKPSVLLQQRALERRCLPEISAKSTLAIDRLNPEAHRQRIANLQRCAFDVAELHRDAGAVFELNETEMEGGIGRIIQAISRNRDKPRRRVGEPDILQFLRTVAERRNRNHGLRKLNVSPFVAPADKAMNISAVASQDGLGRLLIEFGARSPIER